MTPEYGIAVMPKGNELTPRGKPKLMLVLNITTEMTQHSFYLCDASDNFQDVASKITKGIVEAGRQARRAESGLVVVEGGSDGLRTEKQGGKLGGSGSAGSKGPRPA